jgi:hypothetical protein
MTGVPLEPEAPLAFPTASEIFSINTSGVIVSTTRDQGGHWADFAAPFDTSSPMRRIRALHIVLNTSNTYLFYISSIYQVITRRRFGGPSVAWSGAAILAQTQNPPQLNQLTKLAVTSTSTSVDVFFLDAQGHLSITSPFLSTSNVYPAQNARTLETTPSLLVGTALAAISPSDSFQLIFGISRGLNLSLGVWRRGGGWAASRTLGDSRDRHFAHSRLAVFSASNNRNLVYVAGLTDSTCPACIPYASKMATGLLARG